MEVFMRKTQVKSKLKYNEPLIQKMRKKFEEMYIFGDLEDTCERFGVSEQLLRDLVYCSTKRDKRTLQFDTIIRLSNMFDIPYEEFINYNALIDYNKGKELEDLEKEDIMLKQYSVGKKWEDEVIKYYNDRGYFTYKIPTMNSGTVFDIIVIKKGSALLIECKHTDGDKLYYNSSGLCKKRDELNHFVDTTKNNVYIYVKSETTGTWWTTWTKAKETFEEKGYITLEDCMPCDLNNRGDKNGKEVVEHILHE